MNNAIQTAIDSNNSLGGIKRDLKALSDEEFDAAFRRDYSTRSVDGSEIPPDYEHDEGLIAWDANGVLLVDPYSTETVLSIRPRTVE